MNERIRALLSQCTQESIDGPFSTPYVDQEKFAKLIVKECANIAAEQSAIKPEYRIRRHFGVE